MIFYKNAAHTAEANNTILLTDMIAGAAEATKITKINRNTMGITEMLLENGVKLVLGNADTVMIAK